jgi:hypothetical protein
MLPVYVLRGGVLAATSLLCFTLLTACENNAPADQLTVVEGTVTSADSGRPLPGALMAVESFSKGFNGALNFTPTGDSMRTDAQGKYQLSFRNRKGLYYAIGLDPFIDGKPYSNRYTFATNVNAGNIPNAGPNMYELTIGRTNKVEFAPNELRTIAVRIRNRNTRYQRLEWNYVGYLHGLALDTTAYLRNYYLDPAGLKVRYLRYTPAGVYVKDTAVALVVQNPGSFYPDTVRATLTFIR